MKKLTHRQKLLATLTAVGILPIALMADSCGSSAQSQAQQVTEQYSQHAQNAVPYPLTQMDAGGWTERTLLKERLLRQNDPNAIHYVYLLTPQGGLVGQWTIKGMVFSPNSQMTNTQSITWSSGGSASGVVDAPGDNGTWGPEAFCYDFFTTAGNEVRLPCTVLAPIESDTPMSFSQPPVITYDANQKSPLDKGNLAKIGGK